MSYVDENLISGEVVTYRTRLHWTMLFLPGVIAVMFVALGLYLLVVALSGEQENRNIYIVIAIVLSTAGLIPLLAAWLKRSAAEFAVTNKRAVFKTGMMHRKTAEMFLNKIESVGVDQTIAGRVFGYGSVVLRGTGGSTEPFDMVGRPLELRRQIQEQIGKLSE